MKKILPLLFIILFLTSCFSSKKIDFENSKLTSDLGKLYREIEMKKTEFMTIDEIIKGGVNLNNGAYGQNYKLVVALDDKGREFFQLQGFGCTGKGKDTKFIFVQGYIGVDMNIVGNGKRYTNNEIIGDCTDLELNNLK